MEFHVIILEDFSPMQRRSLGFCIARSASLALAIGGSALHMQNPTLKFPAGISLRAEWPMAFFFLQMPTPIFYLSTVSCPRPLRGAVLLL